MIKKIHKKLSARTRKKRFNLFMEKLEPKQSETVLDVGGNDNYFYNFYPHLDRLILLNRDKTLMLYRKRIKSPILIADGCCLPFKDNSIDIVFSNAVLEHLETWEQQKLMAREIARVGKKYFVATPNKWFFYDSHHYLPLYHFLPERVRKFLSRHFSVMGRRKDSFITLNPLGAGQLKKIFPDTKIIRQTFSVYPETLIAYSTK